MGTPQLTVGNVFGTEAIVRYAVAPSVREFPKSSLFGYGLRHSISQYLPMLPFDATVGAFRQDLRIGDIIAVNSTNVALMVGKSVSIFTLYGGDAVREHLHRRRLCVHGLRRDPRHEDQPELRLGRTSSGGRPVSGSTSSGLNLSTDIGFGRVTVVTGSIGVGF